MLFPSFFAFLAQKTNKMFKGECIKCHFATKLSTLCITIKSTSAYTEQTTCFLYPIFGTQLLQ